MSVTNENNTFWTSNLSEVYLDVYVIGFPKMGESILFFLWDSERIIFSVVTDCYGEETEKLISQILKQYGEPKIDYFIWTHPHEDHSKGIKGLLESLDENHNCHVITPNNLHGVNSKLICEEANKSLQYLKDNYVQKGNKGRREHRRYHTVFFDPDAEIPQRFIFSIKDRETLQEMPVVLTILGPDNIASLHASDGTNEFKENALSVVYSIDINGLVLFMTGDVNMIGAQIIPDDYFSKFHFLKIPHHGSNEPKSFLGKLKKNEIENTIGVTTVFPGRNLPNEIAMQHYLDNLSKVYTTGDSNQGNEYGYVHLRYNPMLLKLGQEPELDGNAKCYP